MLSLFALLAFNVNCMTCYHSWFLFPSLLGPLTCNHVMWSNSYFMILSFLLLIFLLSVPSTSKLGYTLLDLFVIVLFNGNLSNTNLGTLRVRLFITSATSRPKFWYKWVARIDCCFFPFINVLLDISILL